MYEWLLDSYVLVSEPVSSKKQLNGINKVNFFQRQDFYIDNHWEKMPNSWKETLANAMPEHLTDLLMPPERPSEKIVWPLSLLALRKLLQQLCIPRTTANQTQFIKIPATDQNDTNNNPNSNFKSAPSLKIKTILMRKKIKAKKQHEIEQMGQLTAEIANKLNVKYIVDFGSGLGHLARLLAYGYRLNVCCLEKENALTDQAKYVMIKSSITLMRVVSPPPPTKFGLRKNCFC